MRAPARLARAARRALACFAEDRRGTALSEFALALVMYLMVSLGLFQISLWALAISATQFAVWEGCHVGSLVYQPPPPDGTTSGGLDDQFSEDAGTAASASFAAVDRIETVLGWTPLTSDYSNLSATIVEDNVTPGEEGRREIVASVQVDVPSVLPPGFTQLMGMGNVFRIERSCSLRLSRFYSF